MYRKLVTVLILFLVVIFAAACSSNSNNNEHTNNNEHANNEHTNNNEHDEEESHDMIPNNGAVIRLISPTEGATFTTDEEIVVEVEIENFPLGEDGTGNHWHIHVGDIEYAMIMNANTSDVIRGLEPGEYTITVRLANGDHQDLEEGDSVIITVE